MQVIGLPGHVIRSAGRRRVFSERRPRLSKRREGVMPSLDGAARLPKGSPPIGPPRRSASAAPRSTVGRSGASPRAGARIAAARRHGRRGWPRPSRRRGPTTRCGAKRKIAALPRQEGGVVSTSMVGRILRKLMDRGVVVPVPTLRRNPGARRVRPTAVRRYARRLPKGRKPTKPGELVQIDTLFVNVGPGKAIKHFTAYDPVAKWTTGLVATRATATAAILDKLIRDAPFEIKGIQVDGGSEFKAAFEKACKDKGLELFVLPPKSPKLNGAVERNQGAWRYEFYASFDLPHRIDKPQPIVDAFAYRFNHHRPHQALGDLTPAAYLQRR